MAGLSRIKAGILLSGGIDSASLAYWIRPSVAFNINYGQKSAMAEREASKAIARALKMPLHLIDVDCSSLGTGDLTDNGKLAIAPVSEWWPYRNQLLITLACMKAIQLGVNKLFLGAVSTDKRLKDGQSTFFEMMNSLIKFQEGNIEILTPAIELTSIELVKISGVPKSILGWTHSCHTSNYPCGKCNGCLKHLATKESIFNF